MISHGACTSETSLVVTVASLQRLILEALIPVPADCEVRSVIKFFECTDLSADRIPSSAVPDLFPHTPRRSTRLLQEFRWELLNHHPPYSPDLAPSDFHLLLHLNKFLSGQRQGFQNERQAEMSVTVVLIPGDKLLRNTIQKLVPRYDKWLNSVSEYV